MPSEADTEAPEVTAVGVGDATTRSDVSPIRLAAIGDSILVDGGLWAQAALEGRGDRYLFPPRFNRAVGGATTQMILGRIEEVIALSPDILILHAGTNDLLVSQDPPRAIYERIVATCARCLSSGIGHIVVVCVLPRQDVFWQNCRHRHEDRLRLNQLLRRLPRDPVLVAGRDKVSILDLEADFDPRADTQDGLHPNQRGAQTYGQAIGRQLARIDGTRKARTLRGFADALGRIARRGLARLRGRDRS